jgi:formylglycine-generating enzyme required for sulfatase activity
LEFARWLSEKDHRKYDLPTEAQWEYAARGELVGCDYPWGDEDPDGRAVFGALQTKPVGSFRPNRYGLYDMAGNADEFVKEADYEYTKAPRTNPVGPLKGEFYISRGGGLEFELKVYERFLHPADSADDDLGFRLVCLEK